MFFRFLTLIAFGIFCGSVNCCASEYKITPIKMEMQNELLIQGNTLLVSGQHNPVILCQTEKTVKDNSLTFYLAFANNESYPINLYFQNLTVTDQLGRPIRVVPKEELISKKKTKTYWKQFASALCTGLESCNAQKAGDVTFQSNSRENFYFNKRSVGTNGWVNSNGNIYGSTSTNGTIHCEALKRQAMNEVNLNGQMRAAKIEGEYKDYEVTVNHCYFDSNTIFPNSFYEGVFQISVPKQIENQLEYIFVNLDTGIETHAFCFSCERMGKHKRH